MCLLFREAGFWIFEPKLLCWSKEKTKTQHFLKFHFYKCGYSSNSLNCSLTNLLSGLHKIIWKQWWHFKISQLFWVANIKHCWMEVSVWVTFFPVSSFCICYGSLLRSGGMPESCFLVLSVRPELLLVWGYSVSATAVVWHKKKHKCLRNGFLVEHECCSTFCRVSINPCIALALLPVNMVGNGMRAAKHGNNWCVLQIWCPLAVLLPSVHEGSWVASWQPNILHTMTGCFGHLRDVHQYQENHTSKSLQECYLSNSRGYFWISL